MSDETSDKRESVARLLRQSQLRRTKQSESHLERELEKLDGGGGGNQQAIPLALRLSEQVELTDEDIDIMLSSKLKNREGIPKVINQENNDERN